MVDNLYSQLHTNPHIGIACLYADFKDRTNQTLGNILGSFLHQLLTTTTDPIPDEITKKLQEQKGKLATKDCLALLQIRLHQLKHVFICIDAIDELDPKVCRELLIILAELCTRNIRLFLTGRGHIESEVQKCLQALPTYTVTINSNEQDIEAFVGQQIIDDPYPDAMDEVLERDIINAMIQKSKGM